MKHTQRPTTSVGFARHTTRPPNDSVVMGWQDDAESFGALRWFHLGQEALSMFLLCGGMVSSRSVRAATADARAGPRETATGPPRFHSTGSSPSPPPTCFPSVSTGEYSNHLSPRRDCSCPATSATDQYHLTASQRLSAAFFHLDSSMSSSWTGRSMIATLWFGVWQTDSRMPCHEAGQAR